MSEWNDIVFEALNIRRLRTDIMLYFHDQPLFFAHSLEPINGQEVVLLCHFKNESKQGIDNYWEYICCIALKDTVEKVRLNEVELRSLWTGNNTKWVLKVRYDYIVASYYEISNNFLIQGNYLPKAGVFLFPTEDTKGEV
jgi:hypothetical protein